MHTVLIALHAASAVAALITGLLAWFHRRAYPAHQLTLTTCVLTLAGAIAVDWPDLDPTTRLVFAAFGGLGLAMVVVAARARRAVGTRHRWAIGFNLVALTDGFVVIAVLNAGIGTIGVFGSALLTAAAGHLVLRWAIDRSEAPIEVRVDSRTRC